jgi:uncharacterized membrane protein
MLATIDWDALLTAVWAATAGGVGVTAAYGFAILGTVRAVDLGREGRIGEAVVYGAIGAIGLLAVLAAIVFGIVVLTNK